MFFCPSRVLRVYPRVAPSDGDTKLKCTGIGFTDNINQLVKFKYEGNEVIEKCQYDSKTDCINFLTPNFIKKSTHLVNEKWSIKCKMDVSLDGITFIPCL